MPWSDNVSGHPIADVTLSACKNSSIELERRGQAVRNSEIEETAQWLKAIGCTEEIAEKFIDEEIDGEALQSMGNEQLLMTIGVQKMGTRLKICKRIRDLLKCNSICAEKCGSINVGKEAPAIDIALTSAGKVSKAGQAFLKAHHPWLHTQYMHSKRLIKTTARQLFSPSINFRDLHPEQAKQLEEAIQDLVPKCSLPEIGFGTNGIRAHLLGSMREHRRRLQALSKRPKAADETSRPKALIERNDLQDLLDEEEEHQEGQDRSTGNNEDVPSTLQPRKKKRTACDTVDVYADLHHDEYFSPDPAASFATVDLRPHIRREDSLHPEDECTERLSSEQQSASYTERPSPYASLRSPNGPNATAERRGERGRRRYLEGAGLAIRQQPQDDQQDENQELSQRSSNAVVAAVLKLPTISMALMDKHLRPMAKLLGVPRYASRDKNWLVVELASRLVTRKWVALHGDKRQLCREDIVVARYF